MFACLRRGALALQTAFMLCVLEEQEHACLISINPSVLEQHTLYFTNIDLL